MCYALTALVTKRLVLVVSPLIGVPSHLQLACAVACAAPQNSQYLMMLVWVLVLQH